MALGILLLSLTVLPLLALATFTPWPFEVAVGLLGLAAAAVVALATREAFLPAAAFIVFTSGVFAARTAAETFRTVAPRRERRRRRPARAHRAADLDPDQPEPWWAGLERGREAA